MKKRYILNCIQFEIKYYSELGISILKKNKEIPYYKLLIFRNFCRAIKKQKQDRINNYHTFTNLFLRAYRLKCFIIELKYNILQLQKTKIKNLYLLQRFKILQNKRYFKKFISNIRIHLTNKRYQINQNINFMQKIYIQFFKMICLKISNKTKLLNTYKQMENIYLYKLARKALKALYINLLINIEEQSNKLHRYIISKIFFNNIKEIYTQNTITNLAYRKLHLKKYYFNRLRRTIYMSKNNHLAKIKFIYKFFLNWKEAIYINKRNRAQAAYKLMILINNIRNRLIYTHISLFYIKLKSIYMNSVQTEINELKGIKLKSYFKKKAKKQVYLIIKYNRIINICKRKKIFYIKRNIFDIFKFIKDSSVPLYIKYEEADKKYNAKLYRKIKALLYYIRKEIRIKKRKIYLFRTTMLKIKIYKYLKKYAIKSKKINEIKVTRFRQYFLYYKIFNLLKIHYLIVYRENKIIKGIQKIIKKNRFKYLYWGYNSIRLNYIYGQIINKRKFKLKIKIFYALKMLTD